LLEHGGHLISAAREFDIPLSDWLDLSTGINPNSWPIPDIPQQCWNRLPESNDSLVETACESLNCASVLPIAGSQAAIQILPRLRPPCQVAVPLLAYQEHRYQWQKAGHWTKSYDSRSISGMLDQIDVLVVINPNNPTGEVLTIDTLLRWHERIALRGGWLIVDEAFMDTTPSLSLSQFCPLPGLIVLRSLGKFFGLAGLRCGFVACEDKILNNIEEFMGPWAVSHPARWIADLALRDKPWQERSRHQLQRASERLKGMLQNHIGYYLGGTALFQSIKPPDATRIFHSLAQQGILVRQINEQILRFGLPGSATAWQRLSLALAHL